MGVNLLVSEVGTKDSDLSINSATLMEVFYIQYNWSLLMVIIILLGTINAYMAYV